VLPAVPGDLAWRNAYDVDINLEAKGAVTIPNTGGLLYFCSAVGCCGARTGDLVWSNAYELDIYIPENSVHIQSINSTQQIRVVLLTFLCCCRVMWCKQ
jgi:hypothetical protein